jgi:hypothetical protein
MVEVLPVAQMMMMMIMMMMMMPFESLCGWPFQDRNRF